jgi:HlyD family secretion protein
VWWKILLSVVVVLLVLLGGLGLVVRSAGFQEKFEQQFNSKLKPVEVKFGEVEAGDIVRTINAPGEVEPKRKVEISAQVSARIIELPVRENTVVKQGDLLLRLDSRDVAALLDAAKAQLKAEEARREGSRAEVANAEAELARRQKLVVSGDIAKAELDQAQLAYDRAVSTLRQVEQGIESARANIRRAEKDLDNTTITAPIDGIVTKLNAEVGETVVVGTLNNAGSVILELADLSVMLMKARVDEANIARVKIGQQATIYITALPDQFLMGVVDTIGLKRMTDTNGTRFFETEILIDRPKDLLLRSGLTASVDVQVERIENVLKVPSQAVQDRSVDDLPEAVTKDNPNVELGKKFTRVVFVEQVGKAQPVAVKVGASDQTHTAVLGGLEKGTRVVVGPFKALSKMEKDQTIVPEGSLDKKNGKKGEAKEGSLPTPKDRPGNR